MGARHCRAVRVDDARKTRRAVRLNLELAGEWPHLWATEHSEFSMGRWRWEENVSQLAGETKRDRIEGLLLCAIGIFLPISVLGSFLVNWRAFGGAYRSFGYTLFGFGSLIAMLN